MAKFLTGKALQVADPMLDPVVHTAYIGPAPTLNLESYMRQDGATAPASRSIALSANTGSGSVPLRDLRLRLGLWGEDDRDLAYLGLDGSRVARLGEVACSMAFVMPPQLYWAWLCTSRAYEYQGQSRFQVTRWLIGVVSEWQAATWKDVLEEAAAVATYAMASRN